jgi:hypothetical protein
MILASNKQQHKQKHKKNGGGERKTDTKKRTWKTKHRETECREKDRPNGLQETPNFTKLYTKSLGILCF